MNHLSRRMRLGSLACIILTATLACNTLLPSRESPLSIEGPPPAIAPTGQEPLAAAEPILVAYVEPSFHLYSLDGALLETRPADGLDWPRPNTAQVVGEDIFYVQNQGPEQGVVVRRVGPAQSEGLEFTRSPQSNGLTFAVAPDGGRIAWSSTAWDGEAPVSQLWMADIGGGDIQLVAETDPNAGITEWFVLEPVEWLDNGDLVYAWQATGLGGYILFFGWSSLYRFSPASDVTTAIAPVEEQVGAPCWNDLATDGAYAVGACGPSAEVIELETNTGALTTLPALPDQGQAGAGAYSPSGSGLAYAIARGDPTNEAGEVIVRAGRTANPVSAAKLAPGYFERLIWIDETRMAVGAWAEDQPRVDVLGVDGLQAVGAGQLVGVMRRAPAVSSTGPCLEEQLATGDLVLEDITSMGELVGEAIEVVVRNPGMEDIATCIPCGTVFEPRQGDSQKLMVIQWAEAVIPAGGEAALMAYVTCIEASQGVPDEGAAYGLGSAPAANLQAFAACTCQEDLAASQNPLDPMSVLFAGWMVSEGTSFSELMESEEEGALQGILGSEAGQAFAGVMGIIEGPAMDRLASCGIQP